MPRWKERLILKRREISVEEPEVAEITPDIRTLALNAVIDLENELDMLKRQIKSKEMEGRLEEDHVDRIRYIQEELQVLQTQLPPVHN